MGGTLAVTVRRPDGKIYRMSRWTNSMPSFVQHHLTFESDEKHINEYIAMWQSMRDDYIANRDTGNFKFDMTPCYATDECLTCSPDGYGLVVVDHVDKIIYSMQNYSSPNIIHDSRVRLILVNHNADIKEEVERLTGLFNGGYVRTKNVWKNEGWHNEVETRTLDEIVKEMTEDRNSGKEFDSTEHWNLDGDLRGWKFQMFEDYSLDGVKKFYQTLKDNGFPLNEEDIHWWEKNIEELAKNEDT